MASEEINKRQQAERLRREASKESGTQAHQDATGVQKDVGKRAEEEKAQKRAELSKKLSVAQRKNQQEIEARGGDPRKKGKK